MRLECRVLRPVHPPVKKQERCSPTPCIPALQRWREVLRRESGDSKKTVIASTASPFKFARAVLQAIQGEVQETDDWTVIELLQKKAGIPIPKAVTEIRHARVLHRRECDAADMKQEVSDILKL